MCRGFGNFTPQYIAKDFGSGSDVLKGWPQLLQDRWYESLNARGYTAQPREPHATHHQQAYAWLPYTCGPKQSTNGQGHAANIETRDLPHRPRCDYGTRM